jgi:methyl-accepting chemotaxis protein
VRGLAPRSAEAAKDIKRLISASTAQVETGVRLVAETGASLERITSQVAEISGAVAAIAAGAKEQAAGLRQVNAAIAEMDEATRDNAAMVEQSTAASGALSRETNGLLDMIGEFSVGAEEPRRALPEPAPRVVAPLARASGAAKARAQKSLRTAAGR